jgi:hypothetical protein
MSRLQRRGGGGSARWSGESAHSSNWLRSLCRLYPAIDDAAAGRPTGPAGILNRLSSDCGEMLGC